MPRREDLHHILIVGSGPIVIGQAGEFDYSGTQALKVLKEEGYRVSLVNSNPATIMTDPDLSDSIYMVPLTVEKVAEVLRRERPDAILPTMGGQTALNLAVALAKEGTLDSLGVELLGTSLKTIEMAEDRGKFKEAMARIGLSVPKSFIVKSLAEAQEALAGLSFPVLIRPSFTLGGTGQSVVYNRDEFSRAVLFGIEQSPIGEILVEESLLGWKEFELEVVRDSKDNAIIVCSIENVDPMGVHTGDSITVAPAMTLTDREYQTLRDASIAILREVGVETGGSNVQFAVNPADGRFVVIEMNPRVSRSSALASKATGFPIARVATRVAIGYTLDEIGNEITGNTPASFEPSLDYVVVKIPRFHFEKFPQSDRVLGPQMQSVGEAMGIGHNFREALLKALRSLENGTDHLMPELLPDDPEEIGRILKISSDRRIHQIAEALRRGIPEEMVALWTGYDRWFLREIGEIIELERAVSVFMGEPLALFPDALLRRIKENGFSDRVLSRLLGVKELEFREMRLRRGVEARFRTVDTCAGEFAARTPYLYGTYQGAPEWRKKKGGKESVLILGSGPNRIGQGVEFDYCCVHGVMALRELGYEAVMMNCNPETVSTDFNVSDRLFFEPLTLEDVLAVIDRELPRGVVVQFGGQTPLKLMKSLHDAGVPILGTSCEMTDLAENRERFRDLIDRLGLLQPRSGLVSDLDDGMEEIRRIGFPVLVRPSYVLGGEAMEILYDEKDWSEYKKRIATIDFRFPLLIDSFFSDATEVDVDAIGDGREIAIGGILEHIEQAGIHSGDSACFIPPKTLSMRVQEEIVRQTKILGEALGVTGLMNIQFAVQNETVYILEVNPRASRTVPFTSKAIGFSLPKAAMRIMMGESLSSLGLSGRTIPVLPYTSVKEAVFPFRRFKGVDTLLSPEMKSTGEVMGISRDFGGAFRDAQIASGMDLPVTGTVFVSVSDRDKEEAVRVSRDLVSLGFDLVATEGTARRLEGEGIQTRKVNKVKEGRPHIVDLIKDGKVQLVINTVSGKQAQKDSLSIRQETLLRNIPYYTTIEGAKALVIALQTKGTPDSLRSLQELHRSIVLPEKA